MREGQFGTPVIIGSDGDALRLKRVPLHAAGIQLPYDENWLQELVFNHPECLPVSELDSSYAELIPVCRELSTQAGPIDVLFVTPDGRLVVLEAKLWRNPEARRKVVGQILDYAKELSLWSYEDLQREVARATKRTGNALFDIAAAKVADLQEALFADAVSRNLEAGRFMLLIVGDGIREGVGAITQFLDSFATLDFSFGLVELAIFALPNGGSLVQPRVLAKSLTIKRSVVRVEKGVPTIQEEMEDEASEKQPTELDLFYERFWREFVEELQLDDAAQPKPNPTKKGNIFILLPPSGAHAWINVYFFQDTKEVGVFLGLSRSEFGDLAYAKLLAEREEIDAKLGIPVTWKSADGRHRVIASTKFPDLRAEQYRSNIKEFLADRANRFVNVFRPRLARIASEA